MYRLTLAQIEAIVWVAKLGSMREAAQRLGLSQPALTHRIREFERSMDLKVFEKSGRNLRLTSDGLALQSTFETLTDVARQVEHSCFTRSRRQRVRIRIGAADMFAVTILPRLLKTVETSFAHLVPEIHVAFSHTIKNRMADGELDVAFLTSPEETAVPNWDYMGQVDLAWMASPSLHLPRQAYDPASLSEYQIISNPPPSLLYESINEWFKPLAPSRFSFCDSLTVIARLAAEGSAVVLLPYALRSVDAWASELQVLTPARPVPSHRMYAVAANGQLKQDARALADEAKELIRRSSYY